MKEDTHDEITDRLCWKGNRTYGWLVTAPFRRNYAAAYRFYRHAAAGSRKATLPSSVLATHSLLGSSASHFFTAVGCCHGQLAHREMCNVGFTAKWAPQYRRLKTATKTRLELRRPLDMS